MTLLVVGVSHRTAPVSLLDRIALVEGDAERLQIDLLASPHVAESLVLSTCNRVEIYAEVSKFHGGVVDVTEALAKATGVAREELTPHLYVRYEDRAVQHMFEVTSGLDSMVVGEQQIVGQVRGALRSAQDTATAGRSINDLAQAALRVGKRVHFDTGIDRAGASVVSVALGLASESLGGELAGRRALVVGAGAMSSLAATLLARAGVTDLVIANRTYANGVRLATQVDGTAIDLADLAEHLAVGDVVVSCTGSTGIVLTTDALLAAREGTGSPLVIVDLALPHDTEESIGDLDGVTRIDLASLADVPEAHAPERDVAMARAIVADEVRGHLAAIAAQRVEPIVVSLRSRADQVVEAELQRMRLRLPELDDAAAAEFARSLRRAVSTLLHTPTVRMKELAADPDGARYATALHRLFDLDPEAIAALTAADDAAVGSVADDPTADPTLDELLGGLS
jgi:glutamyl-tRNA reductase